MEYLESNISWLKSELGKVKGKYLLFDCPGQVELYTHNNAVKNIVAELVKLDVRLVAVHLVDSHYCRYGLDDPIWRVGVLYLTLNLYIKTTLTTKPHSKDICQTYINQMHFEISFNRSIHVQSFFYHFKFIDLVTKYIIKNETSTSYFKHLIININELA